MHLTKSEKQALKTLWEFPMPPLNTLYSLARKGMIKRTSVRPTWAVTPEGMAELERIELEEEAKRGD